MRALYILVLIMLVFLSGLPSSGATTLVTASDGNLSSSIEVRVTVKKPYICGDANADTKINLQDIIYVVNYVFKGGPAPVPVKEAGDVNKDGKVNLSDIIYLVNYIFKGGPKPCA